MRAIVTEYLENPNAKLLAELTTEEQQFVAKQDIKKPDKSKKGKAEHKKEAEAAPEDKGEE